MTPVLFALFTSTVASADCTFRTSAAELATALQAAEGAYATLDLGEFQRAMTDVDLVVPCLEEPVTPSLAAGLHRVRGLGRYAEGDEDAAAAALATARVLDPAHSYSEDVLPKGFELRELYESLPTDAEPAGVKLPRPRDGTLVVDGAEERVRPPDRSILFQRTGEDGLVVETRYLTPSDPVPWYPGARKRQTALLAGSAATAVAAGVLYGLAWSSRGALQDVDPSWTDADLTAIQARTNGLLFASIGVGAVAAGGAGAALLWSGP